MMILVPDVIVCLIVGDKKSQFLAQYCKRNKYQDMHFTVNLRQKTIAATTTKPYQRFLDILDSKSPYTKRKYTEDFDHYLDYLNVKDANSLITKKYYSPQGIQEIEDTIIGYLNHLKKQKLSYETINGRQYAILKFYTANRVNLDRRHISQYKPPQTKTRKDSAYTHEQIEFFIKSRADLRDKVMLLLLCSSGMRIGALPKLTLGDIEKICPEGYQGKHIYKISVYADERAEYYSFTSFEAADFLDTYLRNRADSGEDITNKKAPLLRKQYKFNDKTAAANPQFIAPATFSSTMDRILTESGYRKRIKKADKHQHENMASHACRKFFNSMCIKAGVEYGTKEFLQGRRTTRGLDTSYDRLTVTDRLAEYMKTVELLTIDPSQRLKKQLAESERTNKIEIAELRNENAEIKKQLEELMQGYQRTAKLKINPEFKDRLKKYQARSK